MGNSSQSFDKLKRAFLDLVNDLHARNLAIPAGALVVAIIAAMFVLPKSPAPPPPAVTAPVAQTQEPVDSEAVVALKMVGVTPLDDTTPIANSEDPFKGGDKYHCVRVGSGTPKKFDCTIGDILIHYACLPGVEEGICAPNTGSTAGTGSSGGTGGSKDSGGGSTGDTGNPNGNQKHTTHKKTTYYVADVTVDGHTYNNAIAGDGLPNDKNPLAFFAGASSSGKSALFISGDGVTVTGTSVDPDLGNFTLSKGKSVTITDKSGAVHKLTLKSIDKVTK